MQVLVTASSSQYYASVQIHGGAAQAAEVTDGTSVVQWEATGLVDLTVGSNVVWVIVTAPNGVTQRRHMINIVKYPALVELRLYSNTIPATDALAASFHKTTMSYALTVGSTVAAYTVRTLQ